MADESPSRVVAALTGLKEKLPEGLVSTVTHLAQQHPLLTACLTITAALSILPFITFVAYAVVTLLVAVLFVLVVEGALLALGFFVFFCALLLSFTVSVALTALVAIAWLLVTTLSSFLARRSNTKKKL